MSECKHEKWNSSTVGLQWNCAECGVKEIDLLKQQAVENRRRVEQLVVENAGLKSKVADLNEHIDAAGHECRACSKHKFELEAQNSAMRQALEDIAVRGTGIEQDGTLTRTTTAAIAIEALSTTAGTEKEDK